MKTKKFHAFFMCISYWNYNNPLVKSITEESMVYNWQIEK